jgi:hypothetical protein
LGTLLLFLLAGPVWAQPNDAGQKRLSLTRTRGESNYWKLVINRELGGAVEQYLEELSPPLGTEPNRHKRKFAPMLAALYDAPLVAARLTELDSEFQAVREEVREVLRKPEWN